MNWDRIEENWEQIKGGVKRYWGKLTDDQVDLIAGKRDHLAGRIHEAYGITLEAAARIAGLSPSRARHLFVEQTGLPFRTYLLWLKIIRAVGLFSRGKSLTVAAHEAGFADSAHFSRTFKRMFGIPAAALQIL